MSIKFIKRDVCDVEHGIVAQGVNCQGVMGSGVAKVLRAKDERVFEVYKRVCDFYADDRASMLGMVSMVDIGPIEGELYIANCFTQEFYGKDGKKYASLAAVKEALLSVLDIGMGAELPVYMPRIGCGLGGLDWDTEVGPALEYAYGVIKAIAETDGKPEPAIFVCDL